VQIFSLDARGERQLEENIFVDEIWVEDCLERVKIMEEGKVPKQALWYRPEGRRDPGRPYRKWNS
jgi:hypothetical protein